VVVASSGSTGSPRFATFSRRAVTAAVRASAQALAARGDEAWMLCIPPSHVGGLLVLLRGLILGAPVIAPERIDAVDIAAELRARFMSLVPLQLHRLLAMDADLGHLRAVLVGGDRVGPALATRARETGLSVVATYGQTETCGGVVYDGVPLPSVSVRIGQNAEIELAGPTLMDGYRLDGEGGKRAFTADGWLRTGDAGSIESDGLLTVHGRMTEVIISGGEKVYPAEVEAALRAHPAVADVAVVGRDDPAWGQHVVALVVPAPRLPAPSLEQLRDWVSAAGARYKAPRELVIVDSLPRSLGGKLRRDRLRLLLPAR
jgi:O-succinylbenzoic acid--CoA ligase